MSSLSCLFTFQWPVLSLRTLKARLLINADLAKQVRVDLRGFVLKGPD